jgi:di/tricarboxylate transporter
MRRRSGANLLAIQRDKLMIQPTAKTEIATGDIFLVDLFGPAATAEKLRAEYALEELPLSGAYFTDQSQEIGMVEVILPADCDWIGQTITEARVRDRTGLTVIGMRRGLTPHSDGVEDEVLQLGDTLLLVGPWNAIRNVHHTGGVVALSLPGEYDDVLPVPGKAIQAMLCMLVTIGLMVSGVVPNVQAALIGCLMMGAFGCVNLESSYRSIDWKTIVLIVGMLPFSLALQRTGGVDLASDGLMAMTSGMGTHGVLAAIFAITAILGMFISNTATAVLMAPVALSIAGNLEASPYPFAMIVALAASTAFMTPVSSPVNTLVVTPGNYSFGDFIKIGVPFSILVMIVSVVMVPWLLPL